MVVTDTSFTGVERGYSNYPTNRLHEMSSCNTWNAYNVHVYKNYLASSPYLECEF